MKRISRVDRDAMKRAIEEVRQQGGEEQRQIEAKLASQPWEEVGHFASYSCQDRHLKLEPWQSPPCWLRTDADVKQSLAMPRGDHAGWREAGELVQRLLAAGLSRFEPDPINALERLEAAKAALEEEGSRNANVNNAGEEPRA